MSRMKVLITGISGQDGSYLAELLISKGYDVHGLIRRQSIVENQTSRLDHIRNKITLHYGDLTDVHSLYDVLSRNTFFQVYNLGAMSNVGISFKIPEYTQQVNFVGFVNLIEVIRKTQDLNTIRIYQASSSEMFGNSIDQDGYQRETTQMNPVSPYGVSKLSAYKYSQHVRRAYGMFISNGILFNHESNRRGINFVTGKICKGVADIIEGRNDKLILGNIDTFRDWGHSKDYVKVMYQMLNDVHNPEDYVCSTGNTTSVRELCNMAFSIVGLDYDKYVVQDQKYMRDEELFKLKGDSTKLRNSINVNFEYDLYKMINEMILFHR